MESDWIDLGGDDGDAGEQCDEGKPPDVSPEEFAGLDQATGYEEISRLPEMKVTHEPSARDLEEGTILSTRSVMDLRFRNQKWQRRCRYVAREPRWRQRNGFYICSNARSWCKIGFGSSLLLPRMRSSWCLNVKRSWLKSLAGGMMVKTPGIGFWVDVFLVKDMQQQDSLIFFVNIFKPSIWRPPHCYLAFSGTKRSLWFVLSRRRPHLGR